MYSQEGNVPIEVVARVMGKSVLWVREAIETGRLKIGTCTKSPRSGRRSFYVSPRLLYEWTGYEWKGEEK